MTTEHPHLTRDSKGRILPEAQIIANVEARYKDQWWLDVRTEAHDMFVWTIDRMHGELRDLQTDYLCIPLPRIVRRLRAWVLGRRSPLVYRGE